VHPANIPAPPARSVCRLLGLSALLFVGAAAAQEAPSDTLRYEMEDIVVTATRGPQRLGDLAIPADVLTREDAEVRGTPRLGDLLAEVGGYTAVHAFGTGVQVQGLGPEYTLVLLDGEPVVGRTNGTLDLGRLGLYGVERVEVVRGPFSSLYGSDALAGVVNVISRVPREPFYSEASLRLESHGTADAAADVAVNRGLLRGGLTLHRYRSGGYDLDPSTPEPTAPAYTGTTASARLDLPFDDRLRAEVRGRFGYEDQREGVDVSLPPGSQPLTGLGLRTDWSLGANVEGRPAAWLRATGRLHTSRFETETELSSESGVLNSRFDQRYHKGEVQLDGLLGTRHLVTVGGGVVAEGVEADRIGGGERTSHNAFAFAQEQWLPTSFLEVTASARYDAHSEYDGRLSPALALLAKPSDALRLRASLGSGFKAPTFQQRYLDFTNAPAGYSVFGASDLASVLADLEAQGLVERLETGFIPGTPLRPETSRAFNVGFEVVPAGALVVNANAFYNRVEGLIEIAPVATLTSGRQVYSYFNLDRVRTRGVELGLGYEPWPSLALSARYQYLDAVDLGALEDIESGLVFTREGGRDRPLRADEYGGLFARSRHSGSAEVRWQAPLDGLVASVRGVFRSHYGDYDRNGNLVLDDDGEYVAGHALLHATLTYAVTDWLTVQAGVENLLDYTDPARVPSQPGRLLFGGVRLTGASR
jgi:outer membrane receptor for ferrienterochelin and colicins